ncbi:unnamed protein product [Brugia timori]|uniref:AKAP7_NLS domain-containing protein n=1 Tax=Brugia timori TaxID=42155 RepID=A0A0R3R3Z3_9BILA|nr:unnamed protein product [Brugia timori]
MDEAQVDKHCSVISMIKKACEILKQFVIKKPIQADNDNLATSDGNILDIDDDDDYD